MTRRYIRYRSNYKHQIASEYRLRISIRPRSDIITDYIELSTDGELRVMNGYAWDGPSGPVVDTPETMRASLVHDALYQLMRNGKLVARTHRRTADALFRDLCKEDGVGRITAGVFYRALRRFGRPATQPENKKRVHRAPRGS